MATIVNLFLDSTEFSGATAVYTDIDLTTKAPDGYYTYGTLNRRQLSGLLEAGVDCSTIGPCPEPVNCVVSQWSEWSVCSGGTQTRTRTIITPASGGGTPCPVLEETQPCTLPLSATCFDGIWELNDPQHPNGGYVIYIDANGNTITQNNIWLGDNVTINNNSIIDYGGVDLTICTYDYYMNLFGDDDSATSCANYYGLGLKTTRYSNSNNISIGDSFYNNSDLTNKEIPVVPVYYTYIQGGFVKYAKINTSGVVTEVGYCS